MKSAKTSKNDRKSRDFLPAREARRENLQCLRRKVSDWRVYQPLEKQLVGCPQEKKLYTGSPQIRVEAPEVAQGGPAKFPRRDRSFTNSLSKSEEPLKKTRKFTTEIVNIEDFYGPKRFIILNVFIFFLVEEKLFIF